MKALIGLFHNIANLFAPATHSEVTPSHRPVMTACDHAMLGTDPVMLAVCNHALP